VKDVFLNLNSLGFRCFLALLLIAAILWKIKQKYDRYRRRQRLFVEMEQMASRYVRLKRNQFKFFNLIHHFFPPRPFGTVLVEMDKSSDLYANSSSSGSSSALGNKDESNLRRRRKVYFSKKKTNGQVLTFYEFRSIDRALLL